MEGTKTCPFCAENIKVEALVCRYCNFDLRTGEPARQVAPDPTPQTATPARTEPSSDSPGKKPSGQYGWGSVLIGLLLFFSCVALLPHVATPPTSGTRAMPAQGTQRVTVPQGCVEHIEIHSAKRMAEELRRSEAWVVANYKVNLWSDPSYSRSERSAVGRMLPGSRAVVIDHDRGDYLVKSPLDGSIGWISEVQIVRRLSQDTRTREPCP